jgi:hypothetical protein
MHMPRSNGGGLKRKASDLVADMQKGSSKDATAPEDGVTEEGLSARERNQLRRKQRKRAREASMAPPPPPTPTSAGGSRSSGAVTVTEQPQDDK